jgi:hypothetical protein
MSFTTDSGKVLIAEINFGDKQGCGVLLRLFNLCLNDTVRHWQSQLEILLV